MIKPRPPHQAADKFLRLAKLAVTLGMEFEDAAIGVEHELIESIGPALPRLSSALQTLSQDMRRQAMTPPPEPPPAPKPTPILDYLEAKEQAPPPAEAVPEGPKLKPFVVVVDVEPLVPVFRVALAWPDDEAQEDLRDLLGDRRGFCRLIEVTEVNADAYRETPWLANMERAEILARVDEAWSNSPKLGDSVRAHAAPDEKKACDEPPLTQVDATRDTYAAFAGRNPQFTLEACDEVEATRIVARVFPDRGFRFQAVTPQWAAERKLPCFQHWKEATIKAAQAAIFPGQLCDGYGIPQFNQDGTPLKACDLHAPDPKVPAKPKPSRRKAWLARVAGKPALNIMAHLHGDVVSQLAAAGIPATAWPEAQLTVEELPRGSRDHIGIYNLESITPEKAREIVRKRLAEAEHESGSGFVVPMPEEPPTNVAEADDQVEPQTLVAKHRPTGQRLFTIASPDPEQARDYIGMTLTADQLDEIDLFSDEDVSAMGLPDWEEFDLDAWPVEEPEPTALPAPAPSIPDYPTESPRDPLATLPIAELDLRKPVLELITTRGIATAGQLFDELDGEVLDGLLSEEQETHVRKKILRWESERHARIVADGSWLDEELTYAAFRIGDAPDFWARMRERGATDAELRDAINKRFFAMGGVDTQHRAGYRFVAGAAPAFYRGASKPKRDAEPALEGKRLVDAVRRLLAIPTREEPAAKAGGKASKRKAVKA